MPDITISKVRYAELIIAEQNLKQLTDLIHQKATAIESLYHSDLKILDKLYFNSESEIKENGSK